ncbi:hypothetical protein ACIPF8_12405, partial [Collimonas sp. NPDC087041]|uniref:hypothetical protein n=1 Tax=Collimonas sp. NPDC087041 TaxID=3363960 RepID=UPI0038104CD5
RKRTSFLAHQTPLLGEYSRLKWCPASLDHYKDPCDEIRKQIRDIEAKLATKERKLVDDPYDLYKRAYSTNPGGDIEGKGTYLGHVAKSRALE